MKFLFIIILFFCNLSFANDFDVKNYESLLNKYVKQTALSDGGLQTSFDYKQAHQDKESKKLLSQQKKIFENFNIETLNSKNEALAFWINAYNFFMIVTILENGFKGENLTIDSVKDFGSFFNPYKIFKKELHNIGGKKMSLDHIEKEILLGEEYKKKGWKDARIHFAVNCASVGCPPLLNSAYQANSLEETLNSNLKKAFKSPRHLKIYGDTLYLTSLFKWYKKDFEESAGSTKAFIKPYVEEATFKKIQKTSDIQYIDYNWKLNSPNNFK